MTDLDKIVSIAKSNADENVNLIYGHRIDENIKDRVSVTIIATGFPTSQKEPGYTRPKIDNPNVVSVKDWDKMQKTPVRSEISTEMGNIEQPAIYRLRGRVPGIRTEE